MSYQEPRDLKPRNILQEMMFAKEQGFPPNDMELSDQFCLGQEEEPEEPKTLDPKEIVENAQFPFQLSLEAGVYKGGDGRFTRMVGRCEIEFTTRSSAKLTGSVIPQGNNAVLAFLLTFATLWFWYVIQGPIVYAGPGFLGWFFILYFARRRKVEINLEEAIRVIADDSRREISLQSLYHGSSSWFSVKCQEDYEVVTLLLEEFDEMVIERGRLRTTELLAIIVAGVFIAIAAGLAIRGIVTYW